MKPWLLLVVLASCATTSPSSEVAFAQSALERTAAWRLTLPQPDAPDEVPPEVDELLSAPLTQTSAVRIALLANREARAVLADVGITRGAFVQAGLLPNPEVDFEVRAPGGPQPAQVDVGLEYDVTAAVLTPLRAAVADASLEAARFEAVGRLLELGWQARLAWLDAMAASQRLDLRRRFFESQQASYATAVELSSAGNLPAFSLATERAAVELARLQVAEAENAQLDAREALNRALGLSGARTRYALGPPPPLPADDETLDAETKAIAASLELRAFTHHAESASRKVRLASLQGWVPHVSGGVHGERDGELWEVGAHVAIGLPVFERAQGHLLSARSEYDGLRQRGEAFAVALRSAVRTVQNRLDSARARARHTSERLLPARQRQLELTVLQYNAMQVGVFEVLQAQRAVTDTATTQVDATLEYWKARASLELLLAGRGTPLLGGLGAPATSRSTVGASAAAH